MNIKSIASSRWFHLLALAATIALGVLTELNTPGSDVHIVWAPTAIGLLTAARPLWGSVVARDVFGPATLQWLGLGVSVGGAALAVWVTKSGLVAAPVAAALVTQLRIAFAPAPAAPPPPPTILLLAFLALGGLSCGTTHVSPIPAVVTDVALDCTKEATRNTARTLLDDAATALTSGDWTGALVNLVTRWGSDAIDCAVAEVLEQARGNVARMGSKVDDIEATKAARAEHWLASRGRLPAPAPAAARAH